MPSVLKYFVGIIQAVERLNLKTKLLKDLISDEPFLKSDIITIQVMLVTVAIKT